MKNKLFIIIASLIISAVTITNIVLPEKDFSENENRSLTKLPSISLNAMLDGETSAEFESYVADQFAFRDLWVSAKAHIEKLTGKRENNGVYFATDGYLIEVPDYDLTTANTNLDIIQRFNNATLLLIPTAYEILSDKLPTFAYNNIQTQIIELSKNKVNTICPINSLKKCKDDYIYYKTDHHQTSYGSYITYKDYCRHKAIEPVEYTPIELSNKFYGSTWSKATLHNIVPDTISIVQSDIKCEVTVNDTKTTNSIYDYSKLETKDKYAVFLGGNYGKTVIETTANSNDTVLILKDSYANGLIPFLINHYKKIIMLDLRYYNQSIKQIIEVENPDEVLLIYNVSSLATDNNFKKLLF